MASALRKFCFPLFIIIIASAFYACGGGGANSGLFLSPPPNSTTGDGTPSQPPQAPQQLKSNDESAGGGQRDFRTTSELVLITLGEPQYEGNPPVDPEQVKLRFLQEATVIKLQQMGFEFVEQTPPYFIVAYAGLFTLPPGWDIERAKAELPLLFPDIVDVSALRSENALLVIELQLSIDELKSEGIGPWDWDKLRQRFLNEPTVVALLDMGFNLRDYVDHNLSPITGYRAFIELAPGWTVAEAVDKLPQMFHDIVFIWPYWDEYWYSIPLYVPIYEE